jgi:hypothetical protein
MARILSEIDSPEDDSLSSNPTPPLLTHHPHQDHVHDSLSNLISKAQNVVRTGSLRTLKQPPNPKPYKSHLPTTK